MTRQRPTPVITDENRGTTFPPTTRALLTAGAVAGPLFYLSAIAQMATRPGFDLRTHPISQLSTGEMAWIQMSTFVLAGSGLVCLALGHRRIVTTGFGRAAVPILIAIGGVGFIAAGVFPQDAANGFPLGTPDGPAADASWHAVLHMGAAIFAFSALALAALVSLVQATRERRLWPALGNGVVALALLLPVSPEFASVQVAATGLFAFGWCTVVAARLLDPRSSNSVA